MRQKKYSLPRHTNLAKQSSRTGAFLVDLAITLLMTFILFFLVFRPIFSKRVNANLEIIDKEKINSGLYIKNDKGEPERLEGDADYTEFLGSLEYFYLHYLPGVDLKEGLEPSKDKIEHDVAWFNYNILEIGKTGSNGYFVYAKTGEVDDLTKIGVKSEDTTNDLARIFLSKDKYVSAIQDDFNKISNVSVAGANYMFYSGICVVSASIIAGALVYILVPWLMKNGQTFGKKFFGLGLASSSGYKFSNPKLLMRFMPFLVVDASLIFLIPLNLYIVLTIVLIIFLVSFTVSMSSPKKMALHDFTAQSIVIDLKSSILFDNEGEEELYIAKEDHLLDDEDNIVRGEEPELKYEK